jgi:hypothetical protein
MARKVTTIFVLTVFVLLLVVGMAWARKYAPAPPPENYAREDYVTNYLLKPAGEYSFLGTIHSPYDQILGYTYYDYQHNASIPHMIANDYQTNGGGKHFCWMELISGDMTDQRYMDYNYKGSNPPSKCAYPESCWLQAQRITSNVRRAGYCGLDILKDSREVVFYHYANAGTDAAPRRAMLAIERNTPGYNEFYHYDIPDSSAEMKEGGMWPHAAIDTLNRIHVMMQDGGTAAGKSPWAYVRCQEIAGTDSVLCESHGYSARIKQNVYTTVARKMVGSTPYRTGTIGEIPVCSPVSRKVALIWGWCDPDTTSYQTANNIYYVESTNGGDDWVASGFPDYGDPKVHNVSKFKPEDTYKAYSDIAAVYDYDDNLHIFWNAHKYNTVTGDYNPYDVVLMHWSAATTGQLCGSGADTFRVNYNVVAAKGDTATAGAWNRTIAKMNAGVGVPGGSNANWIYCSWSQFNHGDLSAGKYTNGEIYVSVSTNGGLTWDAPRDVTNSPDPGCTADNCDSDHWGSMAARVDSFLYLQWVNDRDAGGIPQSEGSFTNNPILYYHYPVWTPVAAARVDWTPKNFTDPVAAVPNNGKDTLTLRISDIGTNTLNITGITETVPWMSIGTYPATIAEGACPQDVKIYIDCNGYSNTFLADSIHLVTNDAAGNSDVYVKVYVVVSNTYKAPKFVTVGNGNFVLTQSNLGNIGHTKLGFNLDTLDEEAPNPLYDGSILLGQMASPPLVGRFIFEQKNMLALDTVKVVDKSTVGAIIIKKRYAPMNPIPPAWGNWWCWGVEEYDVIFTSGATTDEKERWIMMQYVKLFQYSPVDWWNPSYPCAGSVPDLYVGEGIDFDMPSDSGSQDTCGFDQALNLLYQQGYGAGNDVYFAGLCLHDPNAAVQPAAYGGHVLRNDEYVYPQSGYPDSLYDVMARAEWAVYDTHTAVPRRTDHDVVLTAGKITGHSLPNTDTTQYRFLVALSNDGLTKLKDLVNVTMCGNTNRDTKINLGDVINLAKYVQGMAGFNPWLYMSDVTGTDCKVNLTDVIYLAKYVQGIAGYDLKCQCEQKWP